MAMAKYCICKKPAGSRFMIGCDGCFKWFHGSCVNVPKKAELPPQWFCPKCKVHKQIEELKDSLDVVQAGMVSHLQEIKSLKTEISSIKMNLPSNEVNNITLNDHQLVTLKREQETLLETIESKNREIVSLKQNVEEQGNVLKTKDREILSLQQDLDRLRREHENCLITIHSKDKELVSLQQDLERLKEREQNKCSETNHSEEVPILSQQQDLELRNPLLEASVKQNVVKKPQASKKLKLRKNPLSLGKMSKSQPLPVNDCLDDDFLPPIKGRKLTGKI